MFDDLKLDFRRVLLPALRAVKDYRGTEPQADNLLRELAKVEEWRNASLPNSPTKELEEKLCAPTQSPFKSGTGDALFKKALPTLYSLLDRALDRVSILLGDSNDPVKIASRLGIACSQINGVYVPPDELNIKTGNGDGNSVAISFYPRIQRLISNLRKIGVYTDDLIMNSGIVRDCQRRKVSYCLLEIPRLDAEVLVCNQVGECTFVSLGRKGVKFYQENSKSDYKEEPTIFAVRFNKEEEWLGEIFSLLKDRQLKAKINVGSEVKLRILEKALAEFQEKEGKECFPHSGSGAVILNGKDSGIVWKYFDNWFRKGDSPEQYLSLIDYLEKVHGKPKHIRVDKSFLTIKFVDQALTEFQEENGKDIFPTQLTGDLIIDGKKIGITWRHVDSWFRGKGSPAKYVGLADYFEKAHGKPKVIKTDLSAVTLAIVEKGLAAFRKRQGENSLPTQNSGMLIIDDKTSSISWKHVDIWFRGKNGPEGYDTLVDYLEKVHGKPERNSIDTSLITLDLVDRSLKEFQLKFGPNRFPCSGPKRLVIDGEETSITWQHIDNWFRKGDSPEQYVSLPDYFEKVHGKSKLIRKQH